MVIEFLRDKVTLGDFLFLLLQVARHLDEFHTVKQWARDRIQGVSRSDKEHLAEVIVHVQVVVVESVILLRVKHFEQRARRIALVVGADLICLVQDKNRVAGLCLAQVLNDTARHSADISTAVTADLRLVVQTTQTDTRVLATQRLRDRATETSLTHTWRAIEA